MISLRQHIFSLVAVFVALAVGIAAGSTVVRGPLLDSTRARLEAAEEIIELERAENDRLAAEVAQLDGWAVDGPPQLLDGALADRAVVLVVAGDTDLDVVTGVIRSIRAASAVLVGEVRVAEAVFDPTQAQRVGDSLEIDPAAGADPQVAFGREITTRLGAAIDAMRGDTTPTRGDLLLRSTFGDLEDDGLVDLLALSQSEIAIDDVAVVVLTDRNLVNDPTLVLDEVITLAAPGGEDSTATIVVVAEVGRVLQDNQTPVGPYVDRIRESGRLRDEVSTVDNAETFLGWSATVLAIRAAADGDVGHYGFREGAERALAPAAP